MAGMEEFAPDFEPNTLEKRVLQLTCFEKVTLKKAFYALHVSKKERR